MTGPLRGLYAITTPAPTARLLTAVAQAIAGGASLVQYRYKNGPAAMRRQQAMQLVELCQQHKVPLIINDDIGLAKAVQADGVHLGQGDGAISEARERLGPTAIIGASCYNCLKLAQRAAAEGADYVAFGSFFPSATKPNAVQAPLQLLHQARRTLEIPIVAIGGITPQNGARLLTAGADALAVIDGLFGREDTAAAARHYLYLFQNPGALCPSDEQVCNQC